MMPSYSKLLVPVSMPRFEPAAKSPLVKSEAISDDATDGSTPATPTASVPPHCTETLPGRAAGMAASMIPPTIVRLPVKPLLSFARTSSPGPFSVNEPPPQRDPLKVVLNPLPPTERA